MMNKNEATKYILQQLCEWYYTLNPSKRVDDKNDLSVLKVLKLVFFLSTVGDEDKTLLGNPFDKFVAMPLGPVETDVYQFFLDNSAIINYSKVNSESLSNIDLTVGDKRLIDNAIEELKKKNIELINQDAFYLVDLTHEWTCWINRYNEAKAIGAKSKPISVDDIKNSTRRFYTY